MDRHPRREGVVRTLSALGGVLLLVAVRATHLWWFWLIVIAVIGVIALAIKATSQTKYATFHVRKVGRRGSLHRGYVMSVSPYAIQVTSSWIRWLLTFGFANVEGTKSFLGPDSVQVKRSEGNRLTFVNRENQKRRASVSVNAQDWPRVLDFLAQTGYTVNEVGGHDSG